MASTKDFFISYDSSDKKWAIWIAWILEEEGYSVTIREWDALPGDHDTQYLQRATSCSRTISILSDAYLRSKYSEIEWISAFKDDPSGKERKLLLIQVGECSLESHVPLGNIIPVDLTNVAEGEALHILKNMLKKRARPLEKPDYPSSQYERVTSTYVNYPGLTRDESAQNKYMSKIFDIYFARQIFIKDLWRRLNVFFSDAVKFMYAKNKIKLIAILLIPIVLGVFTFFYFVSTDVRAYQHPVEFLELNNEYANLGEEVSNQGKSLPQDEYTKLKNFLEMKKWKEADSETFRIMKKVSQKKAREGLREEDILAYPCDSLFSIDSLWTQESGSRFGFSVQSKLMEELIDDGESFDSELVFNRFSKLVGWDVNKDSVLKQRVENSPNNFVRKGNLPFKVSLNIYSKTGGVQYMAERLRACHLSIK